MLFRCAPLQNGQRLPVRIDNTCFVALTTAASYTRNAVEPLVCVLNKDHLSSGLGLHLSRGHNELVGNDYSMKGHARFM